MSKHVPIVEYPAPIPPYEEVIFQEQYVRQVLDPLQIIGNITSKIESALHYPEPHLYYHNVLMSIDEDYRMILDGPVP